MDLIWVLGGEKTDVISTPPEVRSEEAGPLQSVGPSVGQPVGDPLVTAVCDRLERSESDSGANDLLGPSETFGSV